ncbi:hypothetical protein ACLK1T_19200 [Escherichia coli]
MAAIKMAKDAGYTAISLTRFCELKPTPPPPAVVLLQARFNWFYQRSDRVADTTSLFVSKKLWLKSTVQRS